MLNYRTVSVYKNIGVKSDEKRLALTFVLLLLVSYNCSKTSTSPEKNDNPVEENYVFDRWASSENFELTINSSNGEGLKLTINYHNLNTLNEMF